MRPTVFVRRRPKTALEQSRRLGLMIGFIASGQFFLAFLHTFSPAWVMRILWVTAGVASIVSAIQIETIKGRHDRRGIE